MSAIGDCCSPCPPTVPPVNVPGPPGSNGSNGSNGVNAFSIIASFQGIGFVVPAVGASATVYVQDTGEWMVLNQLVYIQSAGQYQVTAAASVGPNGTSVQLKNLGTAGNATPGTSISAGNAISPSGAAGQNSYTVTTSNFTVPNLNLSATINVANSAWMVPGQTVYVQGGGYLLVVSVNATAGTAVLMNNGNAGTTAGAVCPTGSQVGPAGVQGSLPLPVPQSFYSAASAYTLTASMAVVATNDEGNAVVTLPGAGTWLIFARVAGRLISLNSNGLAQVSAQLEAQPSGAGGFSQIPGSLTSPYAAHTPGGVSGNSGYNFITPPVIYQTTTTGDVIALYADYLALGNNTSIQIDETSITAFCLNLST